jgi:hypothetical protein
VSGERRHRHQIHLAPVRDREQPAVRSAWPVRLCPKRLGGVDETAGAMLNVTYITGWGRPKRWRVGAGPTRNPNTPEASESVPVGRLTSRSWLGTLTRGRMDLYAHAVRGEWWTPPADDSTIPTVWIRDLHVTGETPDGVRQRRPNLRRRPRQ